MPATATAPHPLDSYPCLVEVYVCPNAACESNILQKYVFHDYPRASPFKDTTRSTSTYCPHCGGIHLLHQVLQGGRWNPVGNIEVVTSVRARKTILDRVAEIDHDTQVVGRE